MQTRIISVTELDEMAAALEADQVVALPTETVYGLAGRAASRVAVERIFEVKGRPMDNPVIVHAADAAGALSLGVSVPLYARELARRFWPGPMSLVLPSAVGWPWVQGGHSTIAVRVPEPGYLRALIRRVGPLAAPSANRSGRPSPTTAQHCEADLGGSIPLIVDGGPCPGGMESTVVDCTGPAPAILRPGPVTVEMIGDVVTEVGLEGHGASPGTRHPHYRPRARVVLVEDASGVREEGAMTISPHDTGSDQHRRFHDVSELGRELYGWFREADTLGLHTIYVELVPERGLGAAIMNRVRKASERGAP